MRIAVDRARPWEMDTDELRARTAEFMDWLRHWIGREREMAPRWYTGQFLDGYQAALDQVLDQAESAARDGATLRGGWGRLIRLHAPKAGDDLYRDGYQAGIDSVAALAQRSYEQAMAQS